ncbi:MAG TPA: wax ester/triacylglycerol synthase family O-acyltransferase [Myxococcales bacterium]|nr:wax ester/triacylglycerol synthase family O-acyltransferase [Myxococcales bacterium]
MPVACDRLTTLDRQFLIYESKAAHMHVAGNSIFEAGPLRREDGGLDIGRIRAYVESRLERIPRYRQIVTYTPFGQPIWVDDPHFNLDYHVRHTSLPKPGGDAQLKALCGRIFSQALDRTKPLWEIWVVEGVEGGNEFAFISKIHHAMVDGVSSVDLLEVLLTQEPVREFTPAAPWEPRPGPSAREMAVDDVRTLVRAPLRLLGQAPWLIKGVLQAESEVRAAVRGLADLTFKTLRRPAETPLNKRIGPHRRFDWLTLDLGEMKAVRKALGGSINDVVLATVTGAVRRFLEYRGVKPEGIEFRVMAPVSVRRPDEKGALGNRVAAWMVSLPIGERDPRKRLASLQKTTERLKVEKNALGAELLTQMAGWAPATLLSLGARISWRNLPFNMVVTNVPGPQKPVYLLGAKMLADYGLVPIPDYTGLGIVLFSYEGKLTWGLNADWDVMPDLDVFARFVESAFAELRDLARPAGVPAQEKVAEAKPVEAPPSNPPAEPQPAAVTH